MIILTEGPFRYSGTQIAYIIHSLSFCHFVCDRRVRFLCSFPAVEMSLCGGLYDCDIPVERFEQYVITQADFAINAGAILSDQKLVLKINDR